MAGATDEAPGRGGVSRRQALFVGGAGLALLTVGGAAAVLDLVQSGVLPGQYLLDELDGACSVASPPLEFGAPGTSESGTFFSHARNRTVGYTIAFPRGFEPGQRVPLVVCLHGYGGNHNSAFGSVPLREAPSLLVNGKSLRPMGFVSVDGGGGYWNHHPGDDPMQMLVKEVIPMCQAKGLGTPPAKIGAYGVSMGGYGSLLLAERHPRLISAVSAISPAIWTTYSEARSANLDFSLRARKHHRWQIRVPERPAEGWLGRGHGRIAWVLTCSRRS